MAINESLKKYLDVNISNENVTLDLDQKKLLSIHETLDTLYNKLWNACTDWNENELVKKYKLKKDFEKGLDLIGDRINDLEDMIKNEFL